jgi:Zn-dependent protease
MAWNPRSQYGAIMVFVKQAFQVGIIVLVLLAIFGALLTPDPSDDPAGVTVRLDKVRLLVTSLFFTPAVSLPPLAPTSPILFARAQSATTIAKLDLICTRLC